MRIWTLHPQYLDTKGLLAAWRESLLAQKVLQGATKGYRNHPQLNRFRQCPNPEGAIAAYLYGLYTEAVARGYRFAGEKIGADRFTGTIRCTRGQLDYEWGHLKRKLHVRDVQKYQVLNAIDKPRHHPLFRIVAGDVEPWEIIT